MTPRETLELLMADAHPEETLWRDPDGEHYILSRPGAEQRYAQEGYTRLGTVEIVREMLQDAGQQAAGAGSVIFLLVEDVKKQDEREGRPGSG